MSKLYISSSPHIRASRSTRSIMLDVLIALTPVCIFGVVLFGLNSLLLIVLSVATAVIAEYFCNKAMKRPVSVGDLSAVVTGVLYVLCLPPTAPWYLAIMGSLFAIVIAKQLFGGIGANIVNPALAARAFMMLSFPDKVTNFVTDVFTSATPLSKEATSGSYNYFDLLFGKIPGCIGETAKWLILIGFAYLLIRRVISWRIPVVVIASAMLMSLILGGDPIYDLLAGGLIFGAVFMATDYVTSPMLPLGQIIYAIGIGVLIILIRRFAGYPEGVTYAILLMNVATPLIDKLMRRKSFGEVTAS